VQRYTKRKFIGLAEEIPGIFEACGTYPSLLIMECLGFSFKKIPPKSHGK